MSLKQRLLAFVAILLLAVIASLSSVAYWQMRAEIVNGVNKEIEAAVRGNCEALSRWTTRLRDACEAAAARNPSAIDPIPFLIATKDAWRFEQTFIGNAYKNMVYDPVSYTHLDVYKRQSSHRLEVYARFFF